MGTRKGFGGGLLVPQRCTFDNLLDVGIATTDSSYTQAGASPGLATVSDPYSRTRVEVSGAQGVDFDLRAIKAGSPGRDGVQYAYRLTSETLDSKWRGWDGTQLVNGWSPLVYSIGGFDTYDRYDIVTIPSTQIVMVMAVKESPGEAVKTHFVTVDRVVTTPPSAVAKGANWNYPAALVLPESERVLLFYGGTAYYTEDLGVTWTEYSRDFTTADTSTYATTCCAIYRGDMIMLVEDTVANRVRHLVSTDLGGSFRLHKTYDGLGTDVDVLANDDGIIVTYIDTAGDPVSRKLGSVFDGLDVIAATKIKSGGGAHTRQTIASDGGGTLYVLSGDSGSFTMYESRDAAETWQVYDSPTVRLGDSADAIDSPRATWSAGQMCVAHYVRDAGVAVDEKLGLFLFGGWSNTQVANPDGGAAFPENRWGWGNRIGSTGADGYTWVPFILPQNQTWTLAGTSMVLNADGTGHITTAAALGKYSRIFTGHEAHVLQFEMGVVSGGSSTTRDVAVVGRFADNVFDYEYEILFTTTSVDINDVNGAGTASVSLDLTTLTQFRVEATKGTLKVWSRVGGNETLWSEIADIALVDAGAGTPSGIIEWGNIAIAAAESRWRWFSFATAIDNSPLVYDDIGDVLVGKSLNSRPEPVPDLGSGLDVAWLAAVAGPARQADALSVPAYYENGVGLLHAEVSPSTASRWRSTDTSEQIFSYQPDTADSWQGHSVALFVAGANFRRCFLERWNGAVWITEATLDLDSGFSGLDFTVVGNLLVPGGATPDAGRWLWEQELRDGWVRAADVGAIGGTRFVRQSTGGWTTGTTVQPTLELVDPTKITPAAAGTCSLVSSTGLVVVHFPTLTTGVYWRVRIPAGTAGEDTPDDEDYYEAAIIGVYRVIPYGADVEWGMGDDFAPNTASTRDDRGTLRVQERGPVARTWTVGWPNGVHLRQLRIGPDADYIGPAAGGQPLTGAEDVPQLLLGIYQDTDSGQSPVVAVEKLPETSGTVITDRTRFVYGRITGGFRTTYASGDDLGLDEDLRVEGIRIEEIV